MAEVNPLVAAIVNIGLASAIGYVAFRLIAPSTTTFTRRLRGWQWAGYAAFLVCLVALPKAFWEASVDLYLRAALAFIVLVPGGFLAGWAWEAAHSSTEPTGVTQGADQSKTRMSHYERLYYAVSDEPTVDGIAKLFLAVGLGLGLLVGIGLAVGAYAYSRPSTLRECVLQKLEKTNHPDAVSLAAAVCREQFPR